MHSSLFLLFYLVAPQAPIPNDTCSSPSERVSAFTERYAAEREWRARGGKLVEVTCEPAVRASERPRCSARPVDAPQQDAGERGEG